MPEWKEMKQGVSFIPSFSPRPPSLSFFFSFSLSVCVCVLCAVEVRLKVATDSSKDQTYFLSQVPQVGIPISPNNYF